MDQSLFATGESQHPGTSALSRWDCLLQTSLLVSPWEYLALIQTGPDQSSLWWQHHHFSQGPCFLPAVWQRIIWLAEIQGKLGSGRRGENPPWSQETRGGWTQFKTNPVSNNTDLWKDSVQQLWGQTGMWQEKSAEPVRLDDKKSVHFQFSRCGISAAILVAFSLRERVTPAQRLSKPSQSRSICFFKKWKHSCGLSVGDSTSQKAFWKCVEALGCLIVGGTVPCILRAWDPCHREDHFSPCRIAQVPADFLMSLWTLSQWKTYL